VKVFPSRGLSVLALQLALVVGCGGATAGTGTAQPAGSPVNVGIIAPTGTAVFNLPEAIIGARAAVNAVNARGGLNGHKLVLVVCNDKGDPNQTATCARQMVDSKVLADVGGGALTANVIPPILAQVNIPWIGDEASTSAEFNAKNVYLFSGGPSLSYPLLAAVTARAKVPTSILASDTPSGQAFLKGILATEAAAGGSFVAQVPVPANVSDFGPIVAATKPDKAKYVIGQIGSAVSAQFLSAAHASGAKITYMWSRGPTREMLTAASDIPIVYASQYPALGPTSSNQYIKNFWGDVKKLADSGDRDAKDVLAAPSNISVDAWLAVIVIEKLVKNGTIKDLTSTAVTDALNRLNNFDLGGLTPPWTPDAAGPANLTRVTNQSYYLSRFLSGKTTQLTPEPITTADVVSGKATPPSGL
jgi:ABC-type branched-subunit amino acid transport system substrate-binding protein